MQITTRIDYAIYAMLAIAEADPKPVPTRKVADAGQISTSYLYSILNELRRAGLLSVRRGQEGGYTLARAASELTIKQIVEAVDGGLIETVPAPHGVAPRDGIAHLPAVWLAAHTAMLDVLAQVTLAHLLTNQIPEHVRELVAQAPTEARPRSLPQLEAVTRR